MLSAAEDRALALLDTAVASTDAAEWHFGAKIAGHIVSEYPNHEWPGAREEQRVWFLSRRWGNC
ncbi:hypothetical protein CLG96_14305 [Sphingomonas oleivorans]|uniref:Uncharacterized protein n=1 Tax=Sphingomonas oleivorans TaxID=1735121 RepID=A0A2T5FWV1_9SPHN|nr:hypothetical protein CLG96_14305 [Sphingomonas oleivorans]